MDSLTCLSIEKGAPLTDPLRNMVKAAACRVFMLEREHMNFSSDICTGIIENTGVSINVGARRGLLFKVMMTHDGGDCRVNFALSKADLEYGVELMKSDEDFEVVWDKLPDEDAAWAIPPVLTQFADLTRRYLN